MKNMIIFLLLLCGCAGASDITGVYTKHVESEYSIGEDTVFIKRLNDRSFLVERHTGFQRIADGKLSAKQQMVQYSTATPSGSNQLLDTKSGAILTFTTDKLLLGTAEYIKIQ